MVDVVDARTRSRMMAGIRSRDTRPEKSIRRGLHRLGFRFRLHTSKISGRPDLVFPKYHAVVFVHGCFWHGHDCPLFRVPSTRAKFWRAKISQNRRRDAKVKQLVLESGWRYMAIWECALRGHQVSKLDRVVKQTASWLLGQKRAGEIRKRLRV